MVSTRISHDQRDGLPSSMELSRPSTQPKPAYGPIDVPINSRTDSRKTPAIVHAG
jgi:hypothetical protein